MSSSAGRAKRYRQRQRDGQAVYRVVANDDLLLALRISGRLGDEETRNRDRVEQELAALFAEWASKWRD